MTKDFRHDAYFSHVLNNDYGLFQCTCLLTVNYIKPYIQSYLQITSICLINTPTVLRSLNCLPTTTSGHCPAQWLCPVHVMYRDNIRNLSQLILCCFVSSNDSIPDEHNHKVIYVYTFCALRYVLLTWIFIHSQTSTVQPLREWKSNFIPQFTGMWLLMLRSKLTNVSKRGPMWKNTSPGCIPQNKQRCQAICPSLRSGYPAFPLSLSPRPHYHSNPITRPSWAQRAAFWQLDGPLLATGESQPSLRISGIGFHRKWCNKWFAWRNASPQYGFHGWSTACENFCDKPLPTPSIFFNTLWPSDTI